MSIINHIPARPVFVALLALAAVTILAMPFAASAQELRVLAFAGEFANAAFTGSGLPDSGTINVKLTSQAPEAGEPSHGCRAGGANAGTYSVWMLMGHPGGTLTIDTSSSGYDTVISLYKWNTQDIAALQPVACDDDGPAAALLNKALPAGTYYVQISRSQTDVAAEPTLDLAVVISYTPPAGQAVPNNDLGAAAHVTVGKAVRTRNVQFASTQPGEDALACEAMHSVWYTFIAPVSGSYNVSTAGSSMAIRDGTHSTDTKLGIYELNGAVAFANLTLRGCADGHVGLDSAVITGVSLSAGDVIYVQIGTNLASTMLPPSSYRLKVTIVYSTGLLQNIGFETGSLSPGWVLKNPGSQDGVNGSNVVIGSYSFHFFGEPGKNASLKQKWTMPPGLKLAKDTTFSLFFFANISGSVKTSAKWTIRYGDGTPPTVKTAPIFLSTGFYSLGGIPASRNVASVTIEFKDKSQSGAVHIDMVSMSFSSDATRVADGVLPAPIAPQQ